MTIDQTTGAVTATDEGRPYNYRYRVEDVAAAFDYLSGKLHKFSPKLEEDEGKVPLTNNRIPISFVLP